jgi:hypothetical protein
MLEASESMHQVLAHHVSKCKSSLVVDGGSWNREQLKNLMPGKSVTLQLSSGEEKQVKLKKSCWQRRLCKQFASAVWSLLSGFYPVVITALS